MALLAKDEGVVFEKPSVGLHNAVCVFVCDVGTHVVKTQWGDKAQHQIVVCWEIDELLQSGDYAGKPFMVSKIYTFTLFEKGNLSKDLESWFSKKISDETRKTGFDLETLVGRRATLNMVESKDGKYVNVGGILPASKDNILVAVCQKVPAWIEKKRHMSLEMSGENGGFNDQDAPPPTDDGLPF